MVSGLHKLDALTRLLEAEKFDAMLVFVRTKIETVELAQRLEARGFAASALNGDMEQRTREQTVQRLKDGKIDIVIATDVAARGLDVERISHVINYDIPYDPETYVHRIGRTGRAGRTGDAILFVSPRERNMLRVIERVTQQRIEEMKHAQRRRRQRAAAAHVSRRSITAAVLSGAGKDFQPLLEQIETDGNIPAIEIAAALASLMQGSTPLLLSQQAGAREGPAQHRRQRADADLPHRSRPRAWRAAGKHRRLPSPTRPASEGRHIGHIDIRDDHSYVDLPGLPDEVLGQMQEVRVRGAELRIQRVDSKPDKPKFSGQSKRPDRLPAEFADRPPRRKNYEGTPRYSDDAPRRDPEGAPKRETEGASQRFAGYARDDKPRPAGKPPYKSFKKPFKKPFDKSFKKAGPSSARKDRGRKD